MGNLARTGVRLSLRCLATRRTLAGPQPNPRSSLKSPTMGEGRGRSSSETARELQKLKQQALEYYRENDVPRRLEQMLNSTFYLKPADVYGHLVGTWDSTLFHPDPVPPPCAAATRCACAAVSRTRAVAAGVGTVVMPRDDPEVETRSGHLGEQGNSRKRWTGRARGQWARGGFVATATDRAEQASSPPLGRPVLAASCSFKHRP